MAGGLSFDFYRLRFYFRALGAVRFPAGKAGNTLRGAISRHLLPESSVNPPTSLKQPPQPFVFRANHLDGIEFGSGEEFSFDIHNFDTRAPGPERFQNAIAHFTCEGIGPGRGRAELLRVDGPELFSLGFDAPPQAANRVAMRFASPTELKADGSLAGRPKFITLFCRIRDRINTLSALYGPGPLNIDFQALTQRAHDIQIVRCELNWHHRKRRSSRTGQVHSIGGFTGEVEYAGPLGEFLPWLHAAYWTGVGRQTVWGKGDLRVISYSA